MKRKIISMFLCILIIGTITPYAVIASKIGTEKDAINNNSPPNEPTIIAPEKVKRGETFNIKVFTIDPDGDDVYYRVKISESYNEWKGPFPSGVEQDQKLNFLVPVGTYELGVQAKDVHGAESDWSSVNIPVCRSKVITWGFLKFLETYPNIFPFLKTLMSL